MATGGATVPQRRDLLEALLGGIVLFNLADLVLTLLVVNAGLAVEANPAMAALLRIGDLPFALAKLGLVSVCVFVLWRHRAGHLALAGAFIGFGAYSALAVYHVRTVAAVVSWLG